MPSDASTSPPEDPQTNQIHKYAGPGSVSKTTRKIRRKKLRIPAHRLAPPSCVLKQFRTFFACSRALNPSFRDSNSRRQPIRCVELGTRDSSTKIARQFRMETLHPP